MQQLKLAASLYIYCDNLSYDSKVKFKKIKKLNMTDESDFPLQVDDEKNRNSIYCQFCNSIMLKPKTAFYMEDEVKH